MGEEIGHSHFSEQDFAEFYNRLRQETALLQKWIEGGRLEAGSAVAGCELEAWLVGENAMPKGMNALLIDEMRDPLVVPELATFNIELNVPQQRIGADFLDRIYTSLQGLWQECSDAASNHDGHMLAVGILPTLKLDDLSLDNISAMKRYSALNSKILEIGGNKPIAIQIQGKDILDIVHPNIMLEAATTSLQIHLQVDQKEIAKTYNLACMVSAPMVAVGANSPYFLEHDLWSETRIPLFEQALFLPDHHFDQRVTFGKGYAQEESIAKCFTDNLEHYPVLIAELRDGPPEELPHLRLHNGTIWRWNRPLIGFDDNGTPHFRIEHRVVGAGPTIIDIVANMAFFFGLMTELMDTCNTVPELPFETVKKNFYNAAKDGFNARVEWLDGKQGTMSDLLELLLPKAREGLRKCGMNTENINTWLDVIAGRVASGCNGSQWQRRRIALNGGDFKEMVISYLHNQASGLPVHEWNMIGSR